MAYVIPTLADFRLRFPEFDPVSDAMVTLYLDESIADVGDTWLDKYRARAQLYLTAHLLAQQGEPARSIAIANGGNVGSGELGTMTERKTRDVFVKYSDKASEISGYGVTALTAQYLKTTYGTQFYNLLCLNFPAVDLV